MSWSGILFIVVAASAPTGISPTVVSEEKDGQTHRILRFDGHQTGEKQLNGFGKDGWQLTAILKAEDKAGTYLYYFVREGKGDPVREYRIVRAKNHQINEDQLNELGKEKWRLCVVLKAEDQPGGYLYYLVRKK